MKTENHTVTLPIADYLELIGRPAITKERYAEQKIRYEFVRPDFTRVVVPIGYTGVGDIHQVALEHLTREGKQETRFYKPLDLSRLSTEELERELAKRKGEENAK